MVLKAFIKDWISSMNAYDTKTFLEKWHKTAVLDDPSVGQVFKGHSGIKKYFESYFIGYKTQTRLLKLNMIGENAADIEVEFIGEFPEGRINGTFHLTFQESKIVSARAELI